MNIFDFDDYKKFVEARIRDFPSGGRGVFKAMAESMKVPRSTLSQVFNGDRDLTFEQAIDLAGFLELPQLEVEFFMALVERSRAGNSRLKAFAEKKIATLREKSKTLAGRIPPKGVVNERVKATFYSEWYYSAIRMACNLPGMSTTSDLATNLGLPLGRTKQVMEFLLNAGLCIQDKNGFKPGPSSTHIDRDDALVFRHHQNWRMQSIRRMQEYPHYDDDEYSMTIPCTINPETMQIIKKILLDAVLRSTAAIDASPEEHLAFLNVDLLRLKARGNKP